MQPSTRAMAIAIGLSTCTFPTSSARAQPRAQSDLAPDATFAEQYAAAAFEAYGRGAHAEAIALYERALAVAPGADILLYNIARIYDVGLQSRSLAINYYRRYAAARGAVPDRIQIANQRIARLEAAERAATEGLDPSAPEVPRASPPSSSSLASAAHRALPTADGRTSLETASLENTALDNTALENTALAVGGVGVACVGLAGVGLGFGFGLSARAKADTLQRYCEGNACTSQRGVDVAESAARHADVATAGFIAGGALLGLGTVLLWMSSPSENPSAALELKLSPVASDSEVGAAVSGSF